MRARSTTTADIDLLAISGPLPLAALIGSTFDIKCQERSFLFRDMNIATFTYDIAGVDPKGHVIAIHGGPSFCHNYMLPLQLLAREGYSVTFYDQAGCGLSTFVKDPESEAPFLLTLQYYLDELKELISFLGLKEYFLYGSSWVIIRTEEAKRNNY